MISFILMMFNISIRASTSSLSAGFSIKILRWPLRHLTILEGGTLPVALTLAVGHAQLLTRSNKLRGTFNYFRTTF